MVEFTVRRTVADDTTNVIDDDERGWIIVPKWTATDEVGLARGFGNTPMDALEQLLKIVKPEALND